MRACFAFLLLTMTLAVHAYHEPWTTTVYPQDKARWWWSEAWWQDGKIETPQNHDVTVREISFESGDAEVPALVFRPKGPGPFLPVLFQHGRRGLDDLTTRLPRRLAARGFLVLAPDVWSGRFIEKYPIEHDPVVEGDVARAIEVLRALPEARPGPACIVSHTRGGYLALRALVTHGKQAGEVACNVSYYPHWQNPNLPEPMQVYRYAPEVSQMTVPTLVMIGEHEQYNRLRPIVDGVAELERLGRDIRLIVYPGVGRGFDFRPPSVRTFADDLAAKDALQRAARFIRRHLGAAAQKK